MKQVRAFPHARTRAGSCMNCGPLAYCPDCQKLTLHTIDGKLVCENRCRDSAKASA